MSKKTPQKNPIQSKKLRFVTVGIFNTGVDFFLYNLFSKLLGLALPVANMMSTFIAMIISFFLNKKWTFNSKSKDYAREVILFIIFTLFGLWIIQSGLIWLVENTFTAVDWQNFWLKNLLKAFASVPSLIWNYVTYNRFVFKNKD